MGDARDNIYCVYYYESIVQLAIELELIVKSMLYLHRSSRELFQFEYKLFEMMRNLPSMNSMIRDSFIRIP